MVIDHKLALPHDVDDARARAVRKSDSEVHTHTAPQHPWHAWCEGLVHVPKVLHEEFIRKLPRLPGDTDADVAATLIAFYVSTSAALPPDAEIADDDFKFWRRAFASTWATTRGSRHDDTGETRFTRQELEDAKIIRTRAYNGCPHDPRCATFADCIRAIALARKVS